MISRASETERVVDDRYRIDDHPRLAAFYLIDLFGLLLDRKILVDDADAALLGKRDGELASVTVSIADEQSGIFRSIPRENRVRVSTSPGRTSE